VRVTSRDAGDEDAADPERMLIMDDIRILSARRTMRRERSRHGSGEET
jgi:hypothetical protein